ncbi:hypothetical protein [Xanthomonas campestris]|uniref:hypothetical protein n=1 Tax=Xanthomonas campestris TaxID=339 RepID=UPI003CE9E8EF
MNWKRIIGWSALLMILANGIGVLSGVWMAHSEIDPATIDQLVEKARLFRRVAIGLIAVVCYWRLAADAPTRRAWHVIAAFLLVQLIDMALSLAFGAQVSELIEPWGMLCSMLYALAGYVLARLSPNNSFKPNPLRGSA